ncbi:hypothetical protein WJX81_005923 [Elliptochloris bilobata]|uniref:Uncharacterized protein n=1 Tax=Elliptochloris bilobata TaxID=381761 RepID=A0AAW1QJS5_9CHLO
MAWGAAGTRGVEDWVQRLAANDPTLTSIHVFRDRRFGVEELTALREVLRSNTHLAELSAGGLPLPPPAAEILGDIIAASPSLASLCAGDAATNDESIASLAAGLARSHSLQRLDLGHRAVCAAGAAALARALTSGGLANGGGALAPAPSFPSLHTLVLAGNGGLGDAGAAVLAPAAVVLRELDLSACGLGPEGAAALARAAGGGVGASAGPYGRLEVLRLGRNALGPAGAAALAALVGGKGLRELHLPGTGIGDAGLTSLATCLTAASGLALLDVTGCGVGASGAAALTTALTAGAPLASVCLRGNAIGPAGAEALGAALARTATLEELDVGSNQMGEAAAALLVPAPRLRRLSLFGNALGDAGVGRLADSLAAAAHTALLELDLAGCGVSAASVERLFAVLEGGAAPALEMLVLGANEAAEQPDFPGRVEALWAMRPGLDIAWRPSDVGAAPASGGGSAFG